MTVDLIEGSPCFAFVFMIFSVINKQTYGIQGKLKNPTCYVLKCFFPSEDDSQLHFTAPFIGAPVYKGKNNESKQTIESALSKAARTVLDRFFTRCHL